MGKNVANYEQESLLLDLLADRPKVAGGKAVAKQAAPRRRAAPAVRLDWISADAIEVLFNVFLLTLIGSGVIASVVGTFYGIRSQAVPVFVDPATQAKVIDLFKIGADLWSLPGGVFGAVLAQLVLSVFQLRFSSAALQGLREGDPYWWLYIVGYGLALFGSFYFNCQAYWQPAIDTGWNPVVLFVVLIISDMAPELTVNRGA